MNVTKRQAPDWILGRLTPGASNTQAGATLCALRVGLYAG